MKSLRTVVLPICLAAWAVVSSAAPGQGAPQSGKLGPDLFLAITRRDAAAVRTLLARGADPHARNFLQFTPLMIAAASGQPEVVRDLLAAGAELEASSPFGTALTLAALGGSAPVVQLLLERGAAVDARRPDGITVLMLAARRGDVAGVRELLARKADVGARDNEGATALIYTARNGRAEVVRLLLSHKAEVDVSDSQGWTALTHAAVQGHPECVRLLLEHGASVTVRDRKGRTPLICAAAYADEPAVLRLLLERGADPEARDARGRTARRVASARGNTKMAEALREREGDPAVREGETPDKDVRAAIAASLPLLQQSMRVFAERTGCASCHHEGLGRVATGVARERGFRIDAALEHAGSERTYDAFAEMLPLLRKAIQDPAATRNVPGVEIAEYVPIAGFTLAGLAAHRRPADETLAAAALVLARQQSRDGSWGFVLPREPMQSSPFTMTALAIRVMKTYLPKAHAAEMARRIDRARAWLIAAPAETSEDRALRLLGLKWAGADRDERRRAIAELLAEQRPDGGWGQLASLPSDGYATGQALFALNQGGEVPVTDAAYQRGVQFLLRTQEEDGSWFVSKRAMPANNYFDAGFPHGQSQYSSFAGTCWATMALMVTTPPAPPATAGPSSARRPVRAAPRGGE